MDKKGMQTSLMGIIVIAVVLVGAAGAGAYVMTSNGSGKGESAKTIELSNTVPSGVDLVASIEVSEIIEDSQLKSLISEGMSSQSESNEDIGPDRYQDLLKRFEESTGGLVLSDINSMVIFGKQEEDEEPLSGFDINEYGAAAISTEWSENELTNAIKKSEGVGTLVKDSYKEITVYIPQEDGSPQIAVLSEGTYALGTREAIRDIIDTKKGDKKGFSGFLKSEMQEVSSGLISFAYDMPDNAFPEDEEMSPPGAQQTLRKIETVSGSVSKSDSSLSMKLHLGASNEDSAESLKDSVRGFIGLIKGTGMIDSPEVNEALDSIVVEQDESTAVIEYETTIEDMKNLIKELSGLPIGGIL